MLTPFQSHRVACLAPVGRPSFFEGISGCGEGWGCRPQENVSTKRRRRGPSRLPGIGARRSPLDQPCPPYFANADGEIWTPVGKSLPLGSSQPGYVCPLTLSSSSQWQRQGKGHRITSMTAEPPTVHQEHQGGGEGWSHALPRQEEYARGARLADPMDLWTEPSHPSEVGVRDAEQLLMLSIRTQ